MALWVTSLAGAICVRAVAPLLPQSTDVPPPSAALPTTVAVVSFAFAVAQAVLPGPRSAGCAALAISLLGGLALAARGHDPAVVVVGLAAGMVMTPAAYYLAIRLSLALRGVTRRRPGLALTAGAAGTLLLLQALRVLAGK